MPYNTLLVHDDIRIYGIYYPALSVYIHVLPIKVSPFPVIGFIKKI